MIKKLCFFLTVILLFNFSSIGQGSPAYSFGTMQPTVNYRASPGKDLNVTLYFFNAYGNRITHITLSVSDNPDNLDVVLPPLQTNTWNISGIMTPIEENLYVEPMPIVSEMPANPVSGFVYLRAQNLNISGFIPTKPINVTIRMPTDAPLGQTHKLTITALASWYGETGTAQVSQARPFSYNIMVVAENYSESLYTPPAEGGGGLGLSNEMIFGIVIAVLVLVILFQQFRPKKHR
jgi:hypothetical protein